MNIVLTSSDTYAQYIPVLQASFYENHPGITITIYVLTNNATEEHREMIKEFAEKYQQHVHFISVDSKVYEGLENTISGYKPWPDETNFCMFAHQLLPSEVDRALYIGIDTVVVKNISDLYFQDFEDNYIIACQEHPHIPRTSETDRVAEYPSDGDLINGDMMLLNLNKFRNDDISLSHYLETQKKGMAIRPKWFLVQDNFAFLFFRKIKFVDSVTYNCRQRILRVLKIPFSEANPSIIHYTGEYAPKPWKWYSTIEETNYIKGNFLFVLKRYQDLSQKKLMDDVSLDDAAMRSIWWKYAALAPNYKKLLNEMETIKDFYKICVNPLVDSYLGILEKYDFTDQKDFNLWMINKLRSLGVTLPVLDYNSGDEGWNVYNASVIKIGELNGYVKIFSNDGKTPREWATLPFIRSLDKGKKYRYDIKLRYNTSASNIRLFICVINNRDIIQDIYNNKLPKELWRRITGLFEAVHDNLNNFIITSTDLQGENNYISFDYIKIWEEAEDNR